MFFGSRPSYVIEDLANDIDRGSFSESDTRFVSKLGVGAEWKLTEQIALRAEYERYFGVSKRSQYAVDTDYDFVSVGVKYSF